MEEMNEHHCIHGDPGMKNDETAWKIARLKAQISSLEEECAVLRKRIDIETEKGSRFMDQRNFLLDWIQERFGTAEHEAAKAGVRGEWMGYESKAQKYWIGLPTLPLNAAMHCPNCGSFNIECDDVITLDADCWHCMDCKCTWDDFDKCKS